MGVPMLCTWSRCHMDGNQPTISATGQRLGLAWLENLSDCRDFIGVNRNCQVMNIIRRFSGGDVLVYPHLLTTTVGHSRVAAESTDYYLRYGEVRQRRLKDVCHWSLLESLTCAQ